VNELGVHEQRSVINYARFAQCQRELRLKAVEKCFADIRSSRVTENTCTVDEVSKMLDALLESVNRELDGEPLLFGQTSVLSLMEKFKLAEKRNLKLQADISELQNRLSKEEINEEILLTAQATPPVEQEDEDLDSDTEVDLASLTFWPRLRRAFKHFATGLFGYNMPQIDFNP